MKAKIITLENASAGEVELKPEIFGLPLRKDILHRATEWSRAKKRSGNHKTKEIWDVSGTTKKPWKQKGTGRARQGSLRSPQFRGGAIIFGPVVRSHAYDLPKKIRKLALKTALSAKMAEGKLQILQEVKSKTKAKDIEKNFKKMGLKSILIIASEETNQDFTKAVRNLKHIDILPQIGANVYDILRHENLLLTENALKNLQERLA